MLYDFSYIYINGKIGLQKLDNHLVINTDKKKCGWPVTSSLVTSVARSNYRETPQGRFHKHVFETKTE